MFALKVQFLRLPRQDVEQCRFLHVILSTTTFVSRISLALKQSKINLDSILLLQNPLKQTFSTGNSSSLLCHLSLPHYCIVFVVVSF